MCFHRNAADACVQFAVAYTILRQAAAHSRQAFAQALICSSDFIFSHSDAHASQAFAQATQAAGAKVHERAMSFADKPQNS
jgi:hypothetical protein